MTEKYIEDGQVAILYSPGFGAGWSSWGQPELAFDRDLVEAFIKGGIAELVTKTEEKYPGTYVGGVGDVVVGWVTEGTRYRIHEYDGYESIELPTDSSFILA